jgi:hypothetical protein
MAEGYYRFNFGGSPTSDIVVYYSSSSTGPFEKYNPDMGQVLTAQNGDTIYVQLVGPDGSSINGNAQALVARAGWQSGQAYTPFDRVWFTLAADSAAGVWQSQLGTVQVNPGPGQRNYFELTIAFSANLPGQATPAAFAEDPEMIVEGN